MIAHDNKKVELLNWADFNRITLQRHVVDATGTTGNTLEHELGLPVIQFLSGPVGGDQQIGAEHRRRLINTLIFFWAPLEPQPHDHQHQHAAGGNSGASARPAQHSDCHAFTLSGTRPARRRPHRVSGATGAGGNGGQLNNASTTTGGDGARGGDTGGNTNSTTSTTSSTSGDANGSSTTVSGAGGNATADPAPGGPAGWGYAQPELLTEQSAVRLAVGPGWRPIPSGRHPGFRPD